MLVPVYVEFDQGVVRLGSLRVVGTGTAILQATRPRSPSA